MGEGEELGPYGRSKSCLVASAVTAVTTSCCTVGEKGTEGAKEFASSGWVVEIAFPRHRF